MSEQNKATIDIIRFVDGRAVEHWGERPTLLP